jgi:hypothetical protein
MSTSHRISVDFRVTDAGTFEGELAGAPAISREAAILETMIAPPVPPAKAGFEIRSRRLEEIGDEGFRILVEAEVSDEGALVKAASEAWGACWGDPDWRPRSVEEALQELLFHSNANPCPSDMGFEFIGCSPDPAIPESTDPDDGEPGP